MQPIGFLFRVPRIMIPRPIERNPRKARQMARLASYISLFFSALILIHPAPGWLKIWMWVPKLLASALSPFLAIAGAFGALLGLIRRDRKAVLAGLSGAAIAAQHVANVTAPHDGFLQVFGPDWRSRIPPQQRAGMLSGRWTLTTKDPPEVPWQQGVVLGSSLETDDPLRADLWLPPDNVPPSGLVVICLHGSGWHYGDKDMGTRRFFRHLAGQGHVILDVAYTLSPLAQLHAMLDDVKRAIVWMKAKSAIYGVNPERVVLMGSSAGGHLALLAAYAHNHPELQSEEMDGDTSVRAVVSYYGPPDLTALHRRLENLLTMSREKRSDRLLISYLESIAGDVYIDPLDLLPNLLGGTPDQVPELFRLASPIHHVGPHCPPTLLLQGDHDFSGMLPEVRRLHYALLKAGVSSVYVQFPDTDHGFDLVFPKWSPSAQAATYDTERFLALMM